MHQLIKLSLFVFTLISSTICFGQLIWEENFDIPDKGYWADTIGNIQYDLSNINWTINVSTCKFLNENDYAKTVSTAGGRFEVIDSDGELTWISDTINISNFENISISFDTNETGSSLSADKKYIKAFYQINNQIPVPFQPQSEVYGNWGEKKLIQHGLAGHSLQVLIKMNSSYANDKVIIDNIKVEAIDSSLFLPSHIKITESPFFSFSNDTILIRAAIFNKKNELVNDSTFQLKLESKYLITDNYTYKNGFYNWEVSTNSVGPISYTISTVQNELANAESSILLFDKADILFKDYFENSPLTNWNLQSEWELSDEAPISGSHSIKHTNQENEGTSALICSVDSILLNTADYFFSFKIKNGDWNPSTSNSFYFLMTENNSEPYNGYAIGVNASGNADLVSLWKVYNGKIELMLAETSLRWEANQTVQFNISRKANGKWNITAVDIKNGKSFSCETFDSEFTSINELQLKYNYTSTRSGKLWFDDMVVIAQNSAPFISMVRTKDENEFQITFNEAINTTFIDTSNFKIKGDSGKQFTILKIDKKSNTDIVITTETIDEAYLKVVANKIEDLEGKVTLYYEFDFEYSISAEPYDVVITELMVDPNPRVMLPEAEYIEIFNRSNKNIQLEKFSLFVKDKSLPLPNHIIQPEDYLILCENNFSEDFNNYGSVLQLEKFPSLLNSGTTIQLITKNNKIIDEITYSDEWYRNKQKENGGFSLERIDNNRFCGQQNNWAASEDAKGGTPGKRNSIIGNNPDNNGPEIIAIDVQSDQSIKIIFSEILDSASAKNGISFSIQNIAISDIEYSINEPELILNLASTIQANTEYILKLSEIADECGNITTYISSNFMLARLIKGDILINEVLFNPISGGADFIELYNNSGVSVDLNDLKLATRDDSLKLKSICVISEKHISFANETYIALSKDTLNILENYYVPSPNNLIQMSKFPSFNNDEGRIVLLNDSMEIIDEFYYNENMQNEWLNDMEGVSLERISSYQETNLLANWHSASSLVGYATPGYMNSQAGNFIEQENYIEFESDIVSPNGDNYNDELVITIKTDQPGYLSNIYIFNAKGNLLKRLSNNDLFGKNNKLTYDLRDKNGMLISPGTYVILTEFINSDSKKVVLKKAFHVTDRF